VVGCDLEANTATINLYVVDESFEKGMTTDNPKMGRCKTGQGGIIKRAIKVTETFDCLPLTEEEKIAIRYNTCSDSSDYCAEGEYCNYTPREGYRCTSFSGIGSACGGFSVDSDVGVCDDNLAFCSNTQYCINPDASGVCFAYAGDCQSDEDCDDPMNFYCHTEIAKCKQRLKLNDCCSVTRTRTCGVGLECREPVEGESFVGNGTKCLPEQNGTSEPNPASCSCQEDAECFFSELKNGFFCRPFAQPGDSCGGVGIPDTMRTCHPKTSFCYVQDSCYNLEEKGTCVAFSSDVQCLSDADCEESTDWCDVSIGRCKPTLKKDDCCSSENSCGDGLTCVKQYIDQVGLQATCRTICDSAEGGSSCDENEWCTFNDYEYYLSDEEFYSRSDFCKPFASEGEGCESYTAAVFMGRCNPETHFCFIPDLCYVADKGGVCKPLGKSCKENSDCDVTKEWCDMSFGHCRPRLSEMTCCNPSLEEQCKEDLLCAKGFPGDKSYLGRWHLCRHLSGNCSGRFCGGIDGSICECTCEDNGQSPKCMDIPDDGCDPENGGADCAGFCTCGYSSDT